MNHNENLNDVSEIMNSIEKSLTRGVNDRHSDYHTLSVATLGEHTINNRTVVLREFNSERKFLRYHTNFLSEKIIDLKKNNKIACLFYSKKDKVQIRINGTAKIDNNNEFCEAKWNKMSDQSKLCYFQNYKPGQKINNPTEVIQSPNESISELFTIITVQIEKLDWLYLSHKGHKRAIFQQANNFSGIWVAP